MDKSCLHPSGLLCDLQNPSPCKPFSDGRRRKPGQHFCGLPLEIDSTQLTITASSLGDTNPLLTVAVCSVPLPSTTAVGIVCELPRAFWALPVFGCKNVFFFSCLLQHFACLRYSFGCQCFLKVSLETGSAFSEPGVLMSLNFLRAVFKGPLFIMRHV